MKISKNEFYKKIAENNFGPVNNEEPGVTQCANCSFSTESDEWLNSKEAANYLRISEKTLRNLTSLGKVPYYKFGRKNLYIKSELRKLIVPAHEGRTNGN